MCEEPYRLFFPLGILCGIFGVGHWFVYAIGLADAYSGFMHASIQMQVYTICFIAGFLMTAMPRLSATEPASWVETCGLLILILSILASLHGSKWILANLLFVASLVWLLLFGIRRIRACHRQAKVKPPVEFLWVPIALLHGILGSVLLMAGTSKITGTWSILTGKPMLQQGLILSIVLGVGGFLAPRLMGTFNKDRKRHGILHVFAGLVLLASFFLEGFGLGKIAYGVRALLVSSLMIWTRSLVFKPLMTEQYVRLLWLSLWMVALGSWAAFIFPAHRVAMLHFIFIGGYSMMIFAVATMVITSHAGRPEQLRRPSKALYFAAIAVAGSVLLRVISAFFSSWYFQLLGVSSLLWLAGGAGWLMRMIPLVLSFPHADEITKIHEEAKKRVSKLQENVTCR